MRSVSRVADVSINTVTKLLVDVGMVCARFHDESVRNVKSKRIQCDEIWSFCYAKAKNVPTAKAAPEDAGDVWTWTALDADSKLIVSYLVGGRDSGYALEFMDDVAKRLANRVQLTTDGHKAYLGAIEEAFGNDIDYAQLVKLYGPVPESQQRRYSPAPCAGAIKTRVEGNPDPRHVSTSYVERQNLTMRMSMRRFTRLTNGFSKKLENHYLMLSLYFVFYNFCRIHRPSRSPRQWKPGWQLRLTTWIGLWRWLKRLPRLLQSAGRTRRRIQTETLPGTLVGTCGRQPQRTDAG